MTGEGEGIRQNLITSLFILQLMFKPQMVATFQGLLKATASCHKRLFKLHCSIYKLLGCLNVHVNAQSYKFRCIKYIIIRNQAITAAPNQGDCCHNISLFGPSVWINLLNDKRNKSIDGSDGIWIYYEMHIYKSIGRAIYGGCVMTNKLIYFLAHNVQVQLKRSTL